MIILYQQEHTDDLLFFKLAASLHRVYTELVHHCYFLHLIYFES